MDRLLRGRVTSVLILVAASATLPAAILHFFGHEQVAIEGWVHFAFIAAGAATAGAAAFALTIVGARRGDGRTVLVGTAFSTMMGMLVIHGLATPDILIGRNGVIAFSGAAVLPLGGAVLALSALPPLRRPSSVRPLLWLQGLLLLGVLLLGSIGMLIPDSVPAVPETASGPAIVVCVLGMAFFAVLAVRAARTYALTRRIADLVVVLGIVWLGAAVFSQLMLSYLEFGWWMGHALELIGVVMVGVPLALDLHRGASSRPMAGDLAGTDLVEQEEHYLGPQVRALLMNLANKDAYTELHTRRVAMRSVQVGEQLGLSAGRLRSLAIGGLLHDMGKLSVATSILQKPGPLTDDEYAAVQEHPEAGARLVEQLGGFPREVARLVRDHHERLDGSGYPRGLRESEIDLETRILSVCDVYDALLSKRVYREAWSQAQALSLLDQESGTMLDARCVAALGEVLANEDADPRLVEPRDQAANGAVLAGSPSVA
jgi:HD-GYP domain-containing protein (c-di-GMP phosphodiesterase class II)